MDHKKVFGLILDIGAALVGSGAETHRAEDTMYRLLDAYKFKNCNVWLVPTDVQATVTLPDGEICTQIRQVPPLSINYERFDRLNDLSRKVCMNPLDDKALAKAYAKIMGLKGNPVWLQYVGAMLGGPFYALFFGAQPADLFCALLASALILFTDRHVRKDLGPLLRNFITLFFAEALILACYNFGIVERPGSVTAGVIILVVSALGVTNGLRDFVCLDSLSGVINITAAFTGALGIGLGVCAAMVLFPLGKGLELMSTCPVAVQLISCAISSLGFALLFHVHGLRKLMFSALGGLLVWSAYLIASVYIPSAFVSAVCASVFSAVYAQIMARVNRTPATIFMTVSVFPLIPGASLYYTMYGLIRNDNAFAFSSFSSMILTCFAIALGYLAVDAFGRMMTQKSR